LSEIKLLASVCGREGLLLAFLLASLLTIQCIIRWLVVWGLLKTAIEKSAPENLHKETVRAQVPDNRSTWALTM
jgi:hypothetical protein